MRNRKTRRDVRGFTLIELMVVMVIIALLAALVGPRVMKHLASSREKTTLVQIEQLATALESFKLEVGRYPNQQEGLRALVENPAKMANWNGPYLRKRELPMDAWGYPFHYEVPPKRGGIDYDLYSFGADNQPGGDGENADIGNWK
ncbi:MAG: type II secretion system protein GspG [Acidobacteria bacterium RIFCSPLOWO2_12_FULL_67_14b]|nr:MAG: type II secretion system protein GspG [Acidobacteria bacterium RIFCSPLOWO2_12_FULL_67_14b]